MCAQLFPSVSDDELAFFINSGVRRVLFFIRLLFFVSALELLFFLTGSLVPWGMTPSAKSEGTSSPSDSME